jgi:hypothetical protein
VASRVQAEAARAEALAAAKALQVPSLDGWLGGFERAAPAGRPAGDGPGAGGEGVGGDGGAAGRWTAARTKTIKELERELDAAALKLQEVDGCDAGPADARLVEQAAGSAM